MKKAFTLIELLVVISIVSLLASLILASTAQARVKGRNAAAVRQLGQYKNAAALYYANQNEYPNPADNGASDKWYCLGAKPAGADFCAPGVGSLPDTEVNAALATVMPSLPAVSKQVFQTAIGKMGGAGYSCAQYQNGYCVRATVRWLLEGTDVTDPKNCLLGGSTIYSEEPLYVNDQSLKQVAMALAPIPEATPDTNYFICQLSL